MAEMYRISWLMVSTRYYHMHNVGEVLDNTVVPANMWNPTRTFRVTADPWAQYKQLKEWADGDTMGVRDVKLEKSIRPEPAWEEVPATDG